MLSDHIIALQELSRRWRELEERLKRAEQLTEIVTIPAINELRYSGRRFFEAWIIATKENITCAERKDFQDHILMATQYFNNADHDLTDAIVTFLTERKGQILSKYGFFRWGGMYHIIKAWIDHLEQAKQLIIEARTDRLTRFEKYNELQTGYLPCLMERYQEIIHSEELYLAEYYRGRFLRWLERIVLISAALIAIVVDWNHLWQRIIRLLHNL